jgi:hypothetical protein
MKKFCLIFRQVRLFSIPALSLAFQISHAGVLMYEPFSTFAYANGTQLSKNTGNGWTLGNSPGTGSPVITNLAALTFSGLTTSNGSYGVLMSGSPSSGRVAGELFTAQTLGSANPTIYCSILLNVQAAPTANRLIALLASGNSSAPQSPVGIWITAATNVGIAKNNLSTMTTSTTAALTPGTHLIVLRYKWISAASGDDQVDLWVDPTGLGNGEGSVPVSSVSTNSGTDVAAAFDAFYIYHTSATPSGGSGTFWVDEIRVGTNWADVTPQSTCNSAVINSGAAPPSQTAFLGASASFSVGAGGSAPTYQWQISTNGGANFNNVTTGSGGNSASYSTAALAATDNNNQYRCIASVSCDSSSATSAVAAITVINTSIYSFRSLQTGNWNDTNSWQQSTDGVSWASAIFTPTATTSNVTVRAGHTVSVTAPVSVDRLVIQAGGEVDASGALLTLTNTGVVPVDCDVFGILQATNVAGSAITNAGGNVMFENGATFIWNSPVAGAIPVATWTNGSACEIFNGASGTAPTGLNQSFYDFIWNWPGSSLCNLNGQLTTVRRNLTMTGTTSSTNSVRFLQSGITCNLTVGNDFSIAGGIVTLSGGSSANTVLNIFVGRNFTIASGGTLNSRQGKLNSGANSSANIIFTNTAAAQSLTNSGSILHDGDGVGCPINWQVASGVTVNLSGSLPLGPANFSSSDSVIVDGILNLNGNQITGASLGTLTIDATGTLTGSGTNQLATTLGTINYGGTLNLPGLPALNNGDSFKLFDAASYAGAFTGFVPSTPGAGLVWNTSPLTASGTLAVTVSGGGSPPTIRNPILSGGNFIFSGSNGMANASFTILTSTNLALPHASWSVNGTGAFDASGGYSYTNSSGTTNQAAYFIIRVP